MFELKSEATGGTLYVAENQAASMGSHSVSALSWLLQKAQKNGLFHSDSMRDTVSFSFVVCHREAVLYMHWQATDNRRFYISRLKSYSAFESDEIRACNNAVKNTVKNALGAGKMKIGNAPLALVPIPEHWDPFRTDPRHQPHRFLIIKDPLKMDEGRFNGSDSSCSQIDFASS